jgi:hypothetical protein
MKDIKDMLNESSSKGKMIDFMTAYKWLYQNAAYYERFKSMQDFVDDWYAAMQSERK